MQSAIILQAEDLGGLLKTAVKEALSEVAPARAQNLAQKAQIEDSDYLTTAQACKYLHCSRPHLLKLCRQGHIIAHPIGNHNLYRRSELDAYVQSQPRKYTEPTQHE